MLTPFQTKYSHRSGEICNHIFEEFFDDVWDSNIDKNSHNTVVAMIQHAIHATEIMLEVN